MTSAWGRLGTMERISVGLPQLDTSPPATSTASLNNMASTSSHFQGTGNRYIDSILFQTHSTERSIDMNIIQMQLTQYNEQPPPPVEPQQI